MANEQRSLDQVNDSPHWFQYSSMTRQPLDFLERISKPPVELQRYKGDPPWAGKKKAKDS